MKIRTDFVTNSSSSSFVVEIDIEDVNGNNYSVAIDPDDGGGNGDADMDVEAKDIANAGSIDELLGLLKDGIRINKPSDDDWEEMAMFMGIPIEEKPKSEKEKFDKKMEEYSQRIQKEISGLESVQRVVLKRIWRARGEASSCFGANMDNYAPKLSILAKKVCEEEGEEKESAKKQLIDYLNNYSGRIYSEWGGSFPSGFMHSKAKGSFIWNNVADSLEEFAEYVVDKNLANNDYAVETTEIEMKEHAVTQKAEYILSSRVEKKPGKTKKDAKLQGSKEPKK